MKETLRQITAGLLAGAAFALFFGWLGYIFWFSLLVSAGIGVGVYLTIPRKKESHEIEVAPGISQAQLDQTVGRLREDIRRFKDIAGKIPDRETADTVQNLANTLSLLADHFRRDPEDLGKASFFLDQYLTRAHDLAVQYLRLVRMPLAGAEKDYSENVRKTLQRVEAAFDDLYRQCLEDDLTDLHVSSETLQSLMDMDLPHIPEQLPEKEDSLS